VAWFDCATRRPIRTNTGGILSPNLGLILHHQAGNGSLFNWFNNPAARVSAHFWVAKSGAIEQYVDTGVVAWHGMSLNTRYVAVETEGCPGGRDEPFTAAQTDALIRLYAEGIRRHDWARQVANGMGQRGFGFHRMAVATACPCDVRLSMRQAIINRAGQPTPPPTPPQDWFDMATEADLARVVRAEITNALNQGTAQGQQNWGSTNRAILAACQGLRNRPNEISGQIARLGNRQ